MLLNEKGLDYILAILICGVMLFAFLMVPLVMPFAMLVRSMMPLAMLVPLAMLRAIMVATAIPAAALVALYHLLVLLALGLLLVPI
jgi:hypothetical protein